MRALTITGSQYTTVAVDEGSRNKVVVSHGWFKMFFCRGGLNCLTVRAIPLLIFVWIILLKKWFQITFLCWKMFWQKTICLNVLQFWWNMNRFGWSCLGQESLLRGAKRRLGIGSVVGKTYGLEPWWTTHSKEVEYPWKVWNQMTYFVRLNLPRNKCSDSWLLTQLIMRV